jgi:hypothetical protein
VTYLKDKKFSGQTDYFHLPYQIVLFYPEIKELCSSLCNDCDKKVYLTQVCLVIPVKNTLRPGFYTFILTEHRLGFQLAGSIEINFGSGWSLTPGIKFNSLSRDTEDEGTPNRLTISMFLPESEFRRGFNQTTEKERYII